MVIDLPSEYEQMIQRKIERGKYASTSEVVNEALRVMKQSDDYLLLNREEIRRKIAEGMESLRGERT